MGEWGWGCRQGDERSEWPCGRARPVTRANEGHDLHDGLAAGTCPGMRAAGRLDGKTRWWPQPATRNPPTLCKTCTPHVVGHMGVRNPVLRVNVPSKKSEAAACGRVRCGTRVDGLGSQAAVIGDIEEILGITYSEIAGMFILSESFQPVLQRGRVQLWAAG